MERYLATMADGCMMYIYYVKSFLFGDFPCKVGLEETGMKEPSLYIARFQRTVCEPSMKTVPFWKEIREWGTST